MSRLVKIEFHFQEEAPVLELAKGIRGLRTAYRCGAILYSDLWGNLAFLFRRIFFNKQWAHNERWVAVSCQPTLVDEQQGKDYYAAQIVLVSPGKKQTIEIPDGALPTAWDHVDEK